MIKIPVFVSCPTKLNPKQELQKSVIINILEDLQLEPRSLGREDYPRFCPLNEVYIIAKRCCGGIILGFEQIYVKEGVVKKETDEQKEIKSSSPIILPTAWNNLEAGILFGLKLPLLIFKEKGIEGGIFDPGITEVYIHDMPPSDPNEVKSNELMQIFLRWRGEVSRVYYDY